MKRDKDDKLWSDLVRERDGWACQYPTCGVIYPPGHRQGLDAHHIFGRGRRTTRHMLANGISLCVGHHRWAHTNPLEFYDMVRDRLGFEEFDELRRLSHAVR